MLTRNEEFIGTVDIRTLHELNWSIMRLLARPFVERLELQRYKRKLLSSGHWERVRAVPRSDRPDLFDLYGLPAARVDTASVGETRVPYPLL